MKLFKLLAATLLVGLAVAPGSPVSAGSDVVNLFLSAECGDGVATHTITVDSLEMVSQEIEVQLWVNGVLNQTLEYTLPGSEGHDFVFPPMAIDNVVKVFVYADGIFQRETGWLMLTDECVHTQTNRLLFAPVDSVCVDGHYEYTYTFINEFGAPIEVSLVSSVNGVVVEQQFSIALGGTAVADPIVIPTGVALDVDIDIYLDQNSDPYLQHGFTSSTGYPACDDGDSGAGLPDSGADSGTLALLAGVLLLAGVMVTGVGATRRRSA